METIQHTHNVGDFIPDHGTVIELEVSYWRGTPQTPRLYLVVVDSNGDEHLVLDSDV